jgi:uncharacterized membrane protein YeaQ/YmgE (transglycosylase-associated protein family)
MGIISWIVVGAIAGWLSGLVVKGSGFGCLGDIIVGVIGGLLGGWLAGVLFHLSNAVNGINWQSILIAFLGAVLLMLVVRLVRGGGN